jgi:hypothetical protein
VVAVVEGEKRWVVVGGAHSPRKQADNIFMFELCQDCHLIQDFWRPILCKGFLDGHSDATVLVFCTPDSCFRVFKQNGPSQEAIRRCFRRCFQRQHPSIDLLNTHTEWQGSLCQHAGARESL